ncbi:MAG TPA: hypothetical protein VNI02_09725, partial [Blastocatellia bacterium]|nr:hypothetical protein [Blastocatellia bacterium]
RAPPLIPKPELPDRQILPAHKQKVSRTPHRLRLGPSQALAENGPPIALIVKSKPIEVINIARIFSNSFSRLVG